MKSLDLLYFYQEIFRNNTTTCEEEKNNDMLLSYHKEQKKYKEKTKDNVPKKKASREDATLAMLAKFKQKLEKISDDTEIGDKKDEDDGEDEDVTGDDWMKNTLKFESNDPVLAKDASTKVAQSEHVIIDKLYFLYCNECW